MKYDIFISYRRNGGEYTAKIIRDKLSEFGYSVFLDVEELKNGDFNTKLYSVIDECEDFILVLSDGALDKCQTDNDWVRREIEYALLRNKNIVPLMPNDFEFPEVLPKSIDDVRNKNGVKVDITYFDASIERLRRFLLSTPGGKSAGIKIPDIGKIPGMDKVKIKKTGLGTIIGIAVVIVLVVALLKIGGAVMNAFDALKESDGTGRKDAVTENAKPGEQEEDEDQAEEEEIAVLISDFDNIASQSLQFVAEENVYDNYGGFYDKAYYCGWSRYADRCFEVLLDNKYKKFKATLFIVKGTNWESGTTHSITFMGDNVMLGSKIEMEKSSKPIEIALDVSKVNDFKIIFDASYSIHIGNARFCK